MELFILLTTIVIVVVTFILLARFLSIKIPKGAAAPLPPGKMGWPLVGESVKYFNHLTTGHPEKFIQERIRAYGSTMFKTSFLGDPIIVMYGSDANKFLFANEGKLVKGWWPKTVQKILPASMDGTFRTDNGVQAVIKADVLRDYVGIMDSLAKEHFQAQWHSRDKVKVYPTAKVYTLTLMGKLFMSTEDTGFIASVAGPMNAVLEGLVSVPIDLPWTQFGRGIRASKLITSWIKTRVHERRQELLSSVDSPLTTHYQDMVSHLMQLRDENGESMTNDEMAGRLMAFIVASHDAAASVISIVFKYLAQNPEIYNKVHQEQREIASNKGVGELLNSHDMSKMKYSWCVAQEALRICPPQIIFREAMVDFTYNGYHVPKGWKILLSIYATHRDPQYFPNPEKFDPSRFEDGAILPFTYIPFGGGPRICPGRNYAQVVILVFLHNAINKFKWEAVFPDEKVLPSPNPAPVNGLPVRLYPH